MVAEDFNSSRQRGSRSRSDRRSRRSEALFDVSAIVWVPMTHGRHRSIRVYEGSHTVGAREVKLVEAESNGLVTGSKYSGIVSSRVANSISKANLN